ncbi:hypothetical protein [Occallatibacter riparius]|uniref:Uncharacterized protein n=1 Tax=Occallatibacter riparius TaxID=1002689 RepID=A0A9J7BJZ8_9BACT|nr:hypothetical protein [Occallatibacter riparius]UWZ83152.1 hypothetical protein MOP44_21600 [Occallatibacter riparius]
MWATSRPKLSVWGYHGRSDDSSGNNVKLLALISVLLAFAVPTCASPVQQDAKSIILKFAVDGQRVTCKVLEIRLSLGTEALTPVRVPDGFLVPKEILDAYAAESTRAQSNVSSEVTCDQRTVTLTGLYPAQVLPGQWTVGIAYPTTWFDSPSGAPEQGTWVSYVVAECNDCDPGIVVFQAHSDVPATEILKLQTEPHRNAERDRDVAYALAVFGVDYAPHRDHLVKILRECLQRPPNSPEDDLCDGRLVQYISNLYWRGDSELLHLLLDIAEKREDVVDEAGTFYADLLDRRPDVAIAALSSISPEKQRTACTMAFDNDLRFDRPKFDRIASKLRNMVTDAGQRCLDALQIDRSRRGF